MTGVASAIATTNALLREYTQEFNAQILELCVTDREPAQLLMRNFPVPCANRLIVRRQGQGGATTLSAGVQTPVLLANENRLGGVISNSGAASAIIFLTQDLLNATTGTPLTVGTPQIFLAAAGGTWDFRLGNLLWCGTITALSATGTTLLVAEV
jgi:hypothetical protein